MANYNHNNRRKKRRRKPRWGRIILALMLLASCLWLAVRGAVSCVSGGKDKEATKVVAEVATVVADAADAGARADSDWRELFAEEANPWDRHLEAMPDDGCVKLRINPIGGSLAKVFDDVNALHLEAARQIGIDTISSDAEAWRIKRPIVEIRSCREYYVDDLTHSYPFLVPEAARLLADIGSAFNAELAARGGGAYRIKVTSVMRTPLTVGQLRRVNRNASVESAHQYATTFDISYGKFICDDDSQPRRTQEDLKNLLAEVLQQLRAQGRCYVKYEYKQACFHITVRP